MAEKRKRPPSFKLEIPGDESKKMDLYEKMQKVRESLMGKLNKAVNNNDTLEKFTGSLDKVK